jgi:23S rRNA (adenine2503-C2)-methyltransferase
MSQEPELAGRFPDEWRAVLSELGERPFRAAQIFRWIHQRGVFDPASMTDLALPLREELARRGLAAPLSVTDVHASRDSTRKLVLEAPDGARIECVIIPMVPLGDELDADAGAADEDDADAVGFERKRVTLCVSTQFGCAMGCVFCASGQAGLMRGLTAAEIVAQVYLAKRHLQPDEDLKNLVFMGMGEPLHHYDETARAIRLLTHPDGLGMSPRRITVSSVGLVPGLRRLGQDFAGKVGLAVSMHAPNDTVRDRIVPMNQRYPMAELMRALVEYPLPKRRRITIEYILIDGVNDAPEHARELGVVLRKLPVKINLIPMNSISASEFRAAPPARVAAFRQVLTDAGYSCFVRTQRGDEVAAACGQLAMSDDLVKRRRERSALHAEPER